MKIFEWQELLGSIRGDDTPIRTGTIELDECPRGGDYIEVGENDQLQVNKVVHRPGKPTLLVC